MKPKDYFLLSIFLITPIFLFSQILNKGTLQIKPSTTVSFVDVYTNDTSGIHNNDGELYINHSFVNNGSTSANSGTTFFNSAVNDSINISGTTGDINFYNFELDITTASKKGVSVNNDIGLIVANKVSLVSGDLRLKGQAQLVQTHSGVNINTASSGKLLRDQRGVSSLYAYNYWSSPVNNNSGSFSLNGGLFDGTDANINTFTPQQVLFNSGDPYNGIPAIVDGSGNVTTPLYINNYWLYKYSPNISGYAGWESVDENTLLTPGTGFSMKGTGLSSQNYVFKGLPNNGAYSFSINNGESALLGNPYPSALDSEEFITDNISVLDKIYIWVDGGSTSHYLSSYLGGYAVANLSGGTAAAVPSDILGLGSSIGLIPKRYVAIGQGFFVDAVLTGNITFDNSQRSYQVEDGSNSIFYKSAETKDSNNLADIEVDRRIWIGYQSPDLLHRQLLLAFVLSPPGADLGFNSGFDAEMPDPHDDELFFIIDNELSKKYVIQGAGAYDDTYEFPIGLTIEENGTHTIMLDGIENFTDDIFIKDNILNTYYNLKDSDFTPNLPPGDYLDRFSVVFHSEVLSNVNVFDENQVNVYFKNDYIHLHNVNQLEITGLSVFNQLGQKLIQIENENLVGEKIQIPFIHQKGMYITVVESGQNSKSFKIIN
jgi:hypothetical protein